MKKFISLALLFCFFACQKEDVPIYFPGTQDYGYAKGKKNGEKWEASIISDYISFELDSFGIIATTISAEGFLRESLFVTNLPLKTGKYKIKEQQESAYGTTQDDGDVGEDNYILDGHAKDNEIKITSVEKTPRLAVEGEFTVSYKIVPPRRNTINPNKVKFSNVKFRAERPD